MGEVNIGLLAHTIVVVYRDGFLNFWSWALPRAWAVGKKDYWLQWGPLILDNCNIFKNRIHCTKLLIFGICCHIYRYCMYESVSKSDCWNKGTEDWVNNISHVSASVLLRCCRKKSFKQSIDRRLFARSNVCSIDYLFVQLFRKIDSRMMFWKQKVNTAVRLWKHSIYNLSRFTIKYFDSKYLGATFILEVSYASFLLIFPAQYMLHAHHISDELCFSKASNK